MRNVSTRAQPYLFFRVKMEEYLEDILQKIGYCIISHSQILRSINTQLMTKHGYFLLIIKLNLTLYLEDYMLLHAALIHINYYQHLELDGIYVLMKMVIKILQVIQI
jgi:hypothetical protein